MAIALPPCPLSALALRIALGLLVPVAACPVRGAVRINEMVASAGASLSNAGGGSPDWIELFNPGPDPVNLAGYGLSDDPEQPFRWVFPETDLAPGGWLIVYASGESRTNGPDLHAAFALSAAGEPLTLTSPDGQTVSEFPAVQMPRDVSFGYAADGTLRYFEQPTPRAPNSGRSWAGVLHDAPAFSTAGGFHPDAISLSIAPPFDGAVIRYTLDSSEPDESSAVFSGPLVIRSRNGEPNDLSMIDGTSIANQHTDGWKPPLGKVRKATVVRARAFLPDTRPSPVATHTYFIGEAAKRTDGLPVLSLAAGRDGLFDYGTGIYMLGRIFEDYRATHPGEPLTGHTPANYTQRGSEWERPASLEFFEIAGDRAFATGVDLDIKGQSSRSFRQKSFGVAVQAGGTISWPVFPGLTKSGDGSPLTEFRRLRLRNAGNDWDYAAMRDAFCHQLATGLGLDLMAWRPASVYLNGEYWGTLEMREEQDARYFESHYGIDPDDLVVLSGQGNVREGAAADARPFLDLLAFARSRDLSVPENFNYVAARIDVGNFLTWQLAQIFFGNADWPHNNVRLWRHRISGPLPDPHTVPHGHDGRWRWMLFDLDLSAGHPWAGGYGENTLAFALSPAGRPGTNDPQATVLFRALMDHPETRETFATLAADLLNSRFKGTHAAALVDRMKATLEPAMPEHIRRWQTSGGRVEAWESRVRTLRTFASQRAAYVRQHFTSSLNLGGYAALTVNVSPPGSGRVRVNRLIIDPSLPGAGNPAYPWTGTYFRSVPVTLEAIPAPGFGFAGWAESGALEPSLQLRLTGPATLTATFAPSSGPHRPPRVQLSGFPGRPEFGIIVDGAPSIPLVLEFSANLETWTAIQSFRTDESGNWEIPLPAAPGDRGYYRVKTP